MATIADHSQFFLTIDGLSSFTHVVRFEGTEGMSEPFQLEVILTSEDHEVRLADVVGKAATFTMQSAEGAPRYLNGIVSRFRHIEDGKNISSYQATIVPKLWRSRHRHDSRIFQALAVPDIIKKVLDGAGLSGKDYRLALSGSYSPREYCVQYRESDMTFLSRLMEEEGIGYFFEHSDGGHVLVIADANDAAVPIAAPSTIAFRGTLGAMARSESVSRFSCAEEVVPGKITLTDFNFKKPSLSLLESASGTLDSDLEVYDYPGEYEVPGDGKTLAKVRLEEWQARRSVADGQSGCIRLTPGYRFTLSDRVREDENREYLITRVVHKGAQPQMGEVGAGENHGYSNTFQCMPSDVPYRPERRTARPSIKGVQTAIVTGPAGEEVHTDEHGRVKVHFHWDRLGAMDDKSSCWIRVSQIWAGSGWGAMWIPRIGHEVVVDFIEGDPDRPLIVGRVYHGTNVPPYPLPAEKTKSTIKSNSSKGGDGSNELRFEDKKGQEEIFLHGQKDWNIKIEHDESEDVGNDMTIHIGHDRSKRVDNDQLESIGGNKTIEVEKNHTETIDGDESIAVHGNETVQIDQNRTHTVILNDEETVGISQTSSIGAMWTKTVGAAMILSVGAKKTESVGASSSEAVGDDKTVNVGGSASESVAKDKQITVGKKMSLTVSDDLLETISKHRKAEIGESLQIHCGDATITIKKDGKVTVQAKTIEVKADGPVKVNGKKLQVKSDGAVDVKASGNVTVKGGQVKMN